MAFRFPSRSSLLALLCAALFALPALAQSAPPSPDRSAPARPKIFGISHVAVYAQDGAAMRHFLGDVLGFAPDAHLDWQYHISARQGIEIEKPLATPVQNQIAHIAFLTNDCEGMRAYLAAHGVRVPAHVSTAGGTSWFGFEDPNGNPFEFVQSPPAHFTPHDPISVHLIHGGYVVHDRAAEDHLFKDILGFHLYWHGGMQDSKTDWIDMQVPNGTDWFEYMMQPAGAQLTPHALGVMNHYALGVPDVRAAAKRLLARGYRPEKGEAPKIGRDGKWQFNMYDPQGTRVELMEFHAAEKPCCAPFTGKDPQR